MSEKILELGDNYRAVVEHDESAEQPDFEGAPVISTSWRNGTHAVNDEGEPYQDYIRDFVAYHGNAWDLLTRALKIVFGATTVEQFDTMDSTYFVFDPHADFENEGEHRAGIVKATAKEFEAWVDGEVYGVKVEKLVTGRIVFDDSSRDPEVFCEWEEVDSVWGFYGDWILEDANLAETAKGLAGLPTFKSTYGY